MRLAGNSLDDICQADPRRLERRYVRSRSEVDRVAYRRVCRRTGKMLREARSSFVHQQLDEQRHNPRQLWRTVRALLHPGQRRNWYDGEDTDQLAISLGQFFTDKLTSVKHAVKAGLQSMSFGAAICPPHQYVNSVMSEFAPVSIAEVERLIHVMPAKTSPFDIIPISLLKQCNTEIAIVLANRANISFMSGHFPTVMKEGIVVPLLKSLEWTLLI